MTREDAEQIIREKNPIATLRDGTVVSSGDPAYEAKVEEWIDIFLETPDDRKAWGNAHDFLLDFTGAEQAAISLSTDAGVAALRLQLMTWPGQVWTDDPRIIGGMDALVSAGIIDETRKTELMTP